ncbi:MAG: DinB family protein [Ferruginibacter sp.]
MIEQLIETWEISNRINLYLLDAIDEPWLQDITSSKGRNIEEQFAHIHNVRLMWIKEAAPKLSEQLDKLEKGISKKTIATSFKKSNESISTLIAESLVSGKIKGFKPHPVAFVGYLIAHEAHHRGQIMMCLKENKHLTSKSLSFALWQWGTR